MTISIIGARVRQARILRLLTGKALAGHLDWNATRLTRLEQAENTNVAPEVLETLVSVLKFPNDFFSRSSAGPVPVSSLFWRAPKSITQAEKEYLAQFSTLAGEFLDDLHDHHPLPEVQLRRVPKGEGVVVAASLTRHRLGLAPDEPIPYLTHSLESGGVPIIVRSSPFTGGGPEFSDETLRSERVAERHLGYSGRVGNFRERPVVFLRRQSSWERTRLTVAHETGHLVLHDPGTCSASMEAEATRFACELLAPSRALAEEMPAQITLHSLLPLKLRWGISIGALVHHLKDSDLVSQQRFEMLQKQLYTRRNPVTGTMFSRHEPGWDDREPEKPRLLSRWITHCFGTTNLNVVKDQWWPRDLVADMLRVQRPAPSRVSATPSIEGVFGSESTVIDFARARALRRRE